MGTEKYTWGGGSDVSLVQNYPHEINSGLHTETLHGNEFYFDSNCPSASVRLTICSPRLLSGSCAPTESNSRDDSKSGCTELYIEITINIF